MSTAEFPTRLPEKLKVISEHLGLTPDEIAPKVGARTGAEILAYENDKMICWSLCFGTIQSSQDAR
jgi:hypothetical protein